MTGFVLLFAVACLGGVIATVGDRIGMKVGKSRLSLFNLRPRQTATLVSVATGMVASFSTLLLLIALDSQLRKGLFELDEIQLELSQAQSDLQSTQAEKEAAETTLQESSELQEEAQLRLRETNRSLRTAVAREEETLASLVETQEQLASVSDQAGSLRDEIDGLRAERESLIAEQANVRSQIAERDQALALRDGELIQRDQEIAQRNEEIAEGELRLDELQSQQTFLSAEVSRLEQEFQGLRRGSVAIARNQTLWIQPVPRDSSQEDVQLAVETALVRANANALRDIWPNITEIKNFALRFAPENATQVVQAITRDKDYVIHVFSDANYVNAEPCVSDILNADGPPCVSVNLEVRVNRVRFAPGDTVAIVRVTQDALSTLDWSRERFNTLRERARAQANQEGVIFDEPIIARGQTPLITEFFRQIERNGQGIEIRAIASQPIDTVGPVYLELIAVQNGRLLFSTADFRPIEEPSETPSAAPNVPILPD